MNDKLSLVVGERSEHRTQLIFVAEAESGISEITGFVRGPFSQFSKTLTADFPLRPAGDDCSSSATVTEPCYWSPRLPFWYDARLTLNLQNGETQEEVFPVGFKRFYCEGKNLLLEGKRTVLRGVRCNYPTEEDLRLVRKFETALIVQADDEQVFNEASRSGVPLIVDLREASEFENCNFYPAVILLLLRVEQLTNNSWARPRESYIAASVISTDQQPDVECDAFAIELDHGERPPAWLATCNKPVIAICKNSTSEIPTARAGCDRLQAELAPEFDLAGYFV